MTDIETSAIASFVSDILRTSDKAGKVTMSIRFRTLPSLMLLLPSLIFSTGCSKPTHGVTSHAEPEAEAAESAGAAVLTLSEEARESIGLATASVQVRSVPQTLSTTGEIALDPDRRAYVATRVAGRVVGIRKTLGDTVKAGETLAILESAELGKAETEYLEAQARHELAIATRDRQQKLHEEHLTARKDVQAAESDERLARIAVESAGNQLQIMGFSPDRRASLTRSRRVDPLVPLVAPIAGVIVDRDTTLGSLIEPSSEPAFTVADTSSVWVLAQIQEKDLPKVQEGQPAAIAVNAYPGKALEGRISRLDALLDKETRTAGARVSLANPGRRLRPGMFATVRLATGTRKSLAVPAEAILREDKLAFAYVAAEGGKFEERRISVGLESAGFVAVIAGLKPGETVVTLGSFDLRSQARKGTFGDDD